MSDKPSDPQDAKFAWRNVPAQMLPKRSAKQRAADFLEIYGAYDEATAQEQASRCIQCPNPACVQGCPLCSPIPRWMLLTAEGKFLEAAAVVGSAENLPEICSRLCPADRLCEGQCIVDTLSEPVSIRSLEQFLIDYAFSHGGVDASTAPPNGRRVAVVGSGPAGLACVDELSRLGYTTTIFDSAVVPGGLLVNGTPAFELDGSILQRRIELLKARGVKFVLGARLWSEITLVSLLSAHDAVFLGMDARQARLLGIPGAELRNVVPAVSFLLQKSTAVPLSAPEFNVQGSRVIVVGAGDTALDCGRVAVRYGAARVTVVYRRDESAMPCSHARYNNSREEGVDFLFNVKPVELLPNEARAVRGIKLARTDSSGQPLPGTEVEVPADWVIAAIGFDPAPCPEDLDSLRKLGQAVVVDEHQMTSMPGVFAGGDVVRGPCMLLEAVRDARRAAENIHNYLRLRPVKT